MQPSLPCIYLLCFASIRHAYLSVLFVGYYIYKKYISKINTWAHDSNGITGFTFVALQTGLISKQCNRNKNTLLFLRLVLSCLIKYILQPQTPAF
jgi:hypothetical protein